MLKPFIINRKKKEKEKEFEVNYIPLEISELDIIDNTKEENREKRYIEIIL